MCALVTAEGSAMNTATVLASYHPDSHSVSARPWSFPISLAYPFMSRIASPKA